MTNKLIALSFLILVLLFVPKVHAATLTAGDLEISYRGDGSLFNETNIFPGYTEVKSISVKNTGRVNHSFSIAVSGRLGKLADVLRIEPRSFNTDDPIWNKTVSEIAKSPNSNIILGSIEPGRTRQVKIAAILPTDVGNEYQDSTTLSFNFVVGNESTDLNELAHQPIRDIIISSNINNIIVSNTTIAPKDVVENIDVVKSVATDGGVSATVSDQEGKTEGATAESKKVCFWWWISPAVLAIFLIIYKGLIRGRRGWFFQFWPAFAGVFVCVIHWIIHDYYIIATWCEYSFVLILVEVVFYYLLNNCMSRIISD